MISGEPDDFDTIADRGRTDVDLADLLGEHARFGIGLRVPDCRLSWDLGEDGYLFTLWLLGPGSWACVQNSIVRQAGRRRLFDEVISAYSWWQHAGRPHRDRYGVTVTAHSQGVWLDDPTRPVALLIYCSLIVVVALAAVFSSKPSRRKAALEVLRLLPGRRRPPPGSPEQASRHGRGHSAVADPLTPLTDP